MTWKEENEPLGQKLGYPQCCIDAFCIQSPEYLKKNKTTALDHLRYQASFMYGRYTGFIPCGNHALQINAGIIKLSDLIKNRSSEFPDFPNFGAHG